MPAAQKWLTEIFENAAEGVSSAVTPELLAPTQLAWGKNIRTRGAKPGTRPSLKYMGALPSGLVQGVSYFSVQGGMGVISIGGHIYRLRIGLYDATFEEVALPWFNSGIVKQVYMQQTVETLVIQDGQSNPILYDGSTAERSVPEEGGVPLGRQMAYGNGRLWVAINGRELVAGDIRSNVIGSELLFTETNYLSSGGTFFFPKGITGLNFIATTGTSDYGALLIFSNATCDALRADITYRDLWAQTPGFITSVLRHTGCASHWSLAQVNQDLYWRDSGGGIRSIRSSLADESGAGNAPISREVSRLTDYDSQKLLPFCSTIAFNNRLLMTSSPRLNKRGGITWGSLISLDFAPISTMRGKSFPAYDGQWDGLNFTHLFQGEFNGRSRAFAVTLNDDNSNSLWEIMADGRGAIGDETIECSDGSSTNAITCSVEYGRRNFGITGVRKRLERCDVYLWSMRGDVDLTVYWRADNNQKWQSWGDAVEVCAKDGDPEVPGATTRVRRNLLPQQRPQIKSYTIPSNIDDITKYSLANGFEFQIRLVWTGQVHIYKTILHSTMLDDPAWAMRDLLTASCQYNDVSGNQVIYQVPVSPCPFIVITLQPQPVVVQIETDTPIANPYAWGSNFSGEQAVGPDFSDQEVPNLIDAGWNVTATSAGDEGTFFIKADGTLWSCGDGSNGALGLGDTSPRNVLTQIGTDTDWARVSTHATSVASMALKTDGSLWAWGKGQYGQIGVGNTTDQLVPIQVGTDTDWVEIAKGGDHSMAVKSGGTLWTWGRNGNGQLGLGGTTQFDTPQQVGVGTNWSKIGAGTIFSFGIKTDGTLWAWGQNNQGQLGDGSTTQRESPVQIGVATTWASVSGGLKSSGAIKTTGELFTWGANMLGECGLGDTTQRNNPTQVGSDTDWAQLAGGTEFSLARKTDGTIYGAGWNDNFQLGLGFTGDQHLFVQIGTDTTWTAIAAGQSHGLGINQTT